MLERILFNEIPVKDIQKLISWYKDILGFQFVWYSEKENLAQMNLPSGPMLFLNETRDNTTANFTKNGEIHNVLGFQTNIFTT
jgi:catechol-2,3-dioxygenase